MSAPKQAWWIVITILIFMTLLKGLFALMIIIVGCQLAWLWWTTRKRPRQDKDIAEREGNSE